MGEGAKSQRATHARGGLVSHSNMEFCVKTSNSWSPFFLVEKVLSERQQQLMMKMQKNREAQEESQKRREELIKEMEKEINLKRHEKEKQESRRTAWLQEIDAQVGS